MDDGLAVPDAAGLAGEDAAVLLAGGCRADAMIDARVVIHVLAVADEVQTTEFGGGAGLAVREIIVNGVKRAAFSNEAGIGTAPMAHGAAKTSEPVREGLIAMLGPFLDTNIVCTLTGNGLKDPDTAIKQSTAPVISTEARLEDVKAAILDNMGE